MFIFGEKLYGKIYQVPGVCYVATVFFHLFFIPLGPSRSYVVLVGQTAPRIKPTSSGVRGIRIPISSRSIVLGYLRGLLGFILFFVLVSIRFEVFDPIDKKKGTSTNAIVILASIAAGCVFLFLLSRWLTVASESKADELKAMISATEAEQQKASERTRGSTRGWDSETEEANA